MSAPALVPPAPVWSVASTPPPDVVDRLSRELAIPAGACALLAARGLREPDEAKRFLRPRLSELHDPLRLEGMAAAVRRVREALSAGETILVHGDYDVDGIAGAALLTRRLRTLGGRVVPFVPHRIRDGYDFGPAGVDAAREAGAALAITVDSGILAHAAVAAAADAGIDVVVTDHHTPGSTLPPATAVVNPRRPDCGYPEEDLCGAALAFKLARAVSRASGVADAELWPRLDLVALATVADLVPLTGENRTLARYGLRALAATELPGLRALLEAADLDGTEVSAGDVGYRIAPRINAVGRMASATRGLELLLTDDPAEAREIAGELDDENRRRRAEDRRTLDEALERLGDAYDPDADFAVVLASEGWHPGVIGIVASRVAERIHRPTVLVALEGERGRGSARSIPGFDLHDAIAACADHLTRFGGHRQAAGLEVERARLGAFREAFREEAARRLAGAELRPVLSADLELPLDAVTEDLHRVLEYVGPFGIGNPRPTFVVRDAGVRGARVVGDDHLKLRLGRDGVELEAIGFGLAERIPPEAVDGGTVDAVFRIRENVYRGVRTLQARLLDLRPGDGSPGG